MTRKTDDEVQRIEGYDDEPRIDGKSSLDLFRESCEATDRACANMVRNREREIKLALESAVIEPTATSFIAYTQPFGCFGGGSARENTIADLRESLERPSTFWRWGAG